MELKQGDLLEQVNKRFTLNLLIQGAATHTFLTSHYLIRDELNRIHPDLIALYDKIAICTLLAPWFGDLVLICGRPKRFWRRISQPDHPFSQHLLLVQHGQALAEATKRLTLVRARSKGVTWLPGLLTIQITSLLLRILCREWRHKYQLEMLAKRVAREIWGIDEHRLDAQLTLDVEFGHIPTPFTTAGKLIRTCAAGYSGVERRHHTFHVVAKAYVWPLLSHELVKGTAELICLHGLNTLDRKMYEQVKEVTDRIEYESWQMLAGAELWRKLLSLLPSDVSLPEAVMHIARLQPQPLETLMMAVIENPDWARRQLANL